MKNFTVGLIVLAIIIYCAIQILAPIYKPREAPEIVIEHKEITVGMSPSEIYTYLKKNNFTFFNGNPVYFEIYKGTEDTPAFRRWVSLEDKSVEYQYCNTYYYPMCVDTSVTLEELPSIYDKNSRFYYKVVNIYKDYNKKLKELDLTHEQIKEVLDYYYDKNNFNK